MPETRQSTPAPSVYQLRVVVRGVSPLIWRRLLITADTAVAELHAVLQTAFGWGGEHLHRVVIHGVEYGISYPGGVGFRDDPHQVQVAELDQRPTEWFVDDYDFATALVDHDRERHRHFDAVVPRATADRAEAGQVGAAMGEAGCVVTVGPGRDVVVSDTHCEY